MPRHFGKLLTAYRRSRKLPQDTFAHKILTPKDYIWKLETGKALNPSQMMVFRIFTGFCREEDQEVASALWFAGGYGNLYPDSEITEKDILELIEELERSNKTTIS
jgi:transcriptional regulator with XRE-family HTH domain